MARMRVRRMMPNLTCYLASATTIAITSTIFSKCNSSNGHDANNQKGIIDIDEHLASLTSK